MDILDFLKFISQKSGLNVVGPMCAEDNDLFERC